jgi:hypothetical protein
MAASIGLFIIGGHSMLIGGIGIIVAAFSVSSVGTRLSADPWREHGLCRDPLG